MHFWNTKKSLSFSRVSFLFSDILVWPVSDATSKNQFRCQDNAPKKFWWQTKLEFRTILHLLVPSYTFVKYLVVSSAILTFCRTNTCYTVPITMVTLRRFLILRASFESLVPRVHQCLCESRFPLTLLVGFLNNVCYSSLWSTVVCSLSSKIIAKQRNFAIFSE